MATTRRHSGRPTTWLAAVLIWAATACGAQRGEWITLTSAHFRVMTDVEETQARQLVDELEQFHHVISSLTGLSLDLHEMPVPLLYFASDDELEHHLKPSERHKVVAYVVPALRQPYVALAADLYSFAAKTVVFHEYAHVVLSQSGTAYPRWYDEGMAEFLSTARISDGYVELGRPPPRPSILRVKQIAAGQAATGSHIQLQRPRDEAYFYAESWLLVDFLLIGHTSSASRVDRRPQLANFLRELTAGKSEDEAFQAAFGQSRDELLKAAYVLGRRERFPLVRVAVSGPTVTTEVTVEPASAVDVACRRGELSLANGILDDADARFSSALQQAPDAACALVGLAKVQMQRRRSDLAEPNFQRAVAQAPSDPFVRIDYGDFLVATMGNGEHDPDERLRQAREHWLAAIKLNPRHPEGYVSYAASFRQDDPKLELGLRVIKVAAELAPQNPYVRFLLGRLYVMTGQFAAARPHLQFARVAPHAGSVREWARDLLASLPAEDSAEPPQEPPTGAGAADADATGEAAPPAP